MNAPMGGSAGSQIAEQRYAALRLQQAVAAGVVPASVLNAHPNAYPALWRMVSKQVSAPAEQAGFADPSAWLRQAGGQINPSQPYGGNAPAIPDAPQDAAPPLFMPHHPAPQDLAPPFPAGYDIKGGAPGPPQAPPQAQMPDGHWGNPNMNPMQWEALLRMLGMGAQRPGNVRYA